MHLSFSLFSLSYIDRFVVEVVTDFLLEVNDWCLGKSKAEIL